MENEILNKMQALVNEFESLKSLTLLGTKKALTMTDAALLTGLSKSYLYKCVCFKNIPYYKSTGGKYTYFDRDELNAWMLHQRFKTNDEIETEAANIAVFGKNRKLVKNV